MNGEQVGASGAQPNPVLVELLAGDAMGLSAAAKSIPSSRASKTGRVHISTVWHWINDGVKRSDGVTVRLEAVRLGASWFTSKAAIARFVDAMTPGAPVPAPAPVARTNTKRQRDAEAASKRLQAAGA